MNRSWFYLPPCVCVCSRAIVNVHIQSLREPAAQVMVTNVWASCIRLH